MSQDQQTYQRAVSASLLGLVIQLVVSALLLIMSLWMQSALITVVTFYSFGGVVLWITLTVLHQQHKLERIEALEANELAQRHGTDSSIFSTSAEDLSIARRRLERLQKWALPASGIVTAGYLIGVGIWQLVINSKLLETKPLAKDRLDIDPNMLTLAGGNPIENAGVMLPVLGGVAFLLFIVSRYIAGMANVKHWQMLRGGAGYLMGVALVCAMISLGYGLMLLPSPVSVVLIYMIAILPAFMILIGTEMLLNLVLDLYRPRKVGQMPRPAFDSRLLSFLTSPESIARSINEAVNYQFGFEITQSWFWRLFTHALPSLILFSGAVLFGASSLVFIDHGDRGVVTRFGQLKEDVLGPGIHLKAPWPFETVDRYQVDRIQQLAFGSDIVLKEGEAILWDNVHSETEPIHLIVAPLSSVRTEDSRTDEEQQQDDTRQDTTPSVALLDIDVTLQYRVRDLIEYLTYNDDPIARMKTLADSELSRYLLSRNIDEWLSVSRRKTAEELRVRIQKACDDAKLGVEILEVPVSSIHPPRDVASAFHEVIKSTHQREILISSARADEIAALVGAAGSVEEAQSIFKMIDEARSLSGEAAEGKALEIERALTQAGGEAAVILAKAKGDRWKHENTEIAAAMRFPQELATYRASPEVYRMREYLKVLLEQAKTSKVYLILADPDRVTLRFKLDEPIGTIPGLDPSSTH